MAILRTTTPGSDLYFIWSAAYPTRPDVFHCVWCHLEPGHQGKVIFGYRAALTHFKRHRDAGHAVPDSAFEEIRHMQHEYSLNSPDKGV